MVTYWRPTGVEFDDPQFVEKFKQASQNGRFLTDEEFEQEKKTVKYPEFLHKTKLEDANAFVNHNNPGHEKNDKGHLGDPEFKNLFKGNTKVEKFDLSPNYGTEIDGIQLSELDDAAKNDLALLIETRGLLVFRNQDFRDKGPKFVRDYGRYFGPLHIHHTSYAAENYPEIFVTIRKEGDETRYEKEFKNKTGTFVWHSDVSFERYPSSFSFFVALEAPPSGGDTVFVDLREAYKRLSPELQKFFETLTVVHSNHYQRKIAALNNHATKVKETSFSEHPLVRTHPVTGEKSLFFSRGFIQYVKGVKPSESDFILNFLEDHVLNNPEFQIRATHRGTDSRTVIVWDNRFLVHTAVADFLQHQTGPRHHFRLTVLGERPYFETPKGEEEDEKVEKEQTQKSGSESPSARPKAY